MKIVDLSLQLARKTLLHNLSFEIPKQSIFLFLGANGAGKTLLLHSLAGLHKNLTGQIEDSSKDLCFVPLSQPLPFEFRALDLIIMGRYPKHKGYPGELDTKMARSAAARLGITDLLLRAYNSLSRGEQTKVDIARAIASEAEVILLDEPFANLDIDACLSIITLFQELRSQGKTLILSHHDLYSARRLATHALLLHKGQLLKAGKIEEVFQEEWLRAAYNVKPVFGENGHLRFESLNS